MLNDSPVDCQIRGKALPAGKGVLAPLSDKKGTFLRALFVLIKRQKDSKGKRSLVKINKKSKCKENL